VQQWERDIPIRDKAYGDGLFYLKKTNDAPQLMLRLSQKV